MKTSSQCVLFTKAISRRISPPIVSVLYMCSICWSCRSLCSKGRKSYFRACIDLNNRIMLEPDPLLVRWLPTFLSRRSNSTMCLFLISISAFLTETYCFMCGHCMIFIFSLHTEIVWAIRDVIITVWCWLISIRGHVLVLSLFLLSKISLSTFVSLYLAICAIYCSQLTNYNTLVIPRTSFDYTSHIDWTILMKL